MSRYRIHRPRCGRGGFSLIELLVVVGIVVILLCIFIPALLWIRETNHRALCAGNLRQIGLALTYYAGDNHHQAYSPYPRVRYDAEKKPFGYTAFTGPDAASAFMADSAVAANDVTASLWLLVKGRYVRPDVFICPSTSDEADAMTDASGRPVGPDQRSNFRSPRNLSYSYCSPFSNATGFGMVDPSPTGFALMADKNPGVHPPGSDVTGPSHDAPPFEMARANSNNHGRAGQNVLFADGHVDFMTTPYCGVEGDNIYTALAKKPIFTGKKPPLDANGYCGRDMGPAWQTDSYLVPAE